MTAQIPDKLWFWGLRLTWFAPPLAHLAQGGDEFELQDSTACWRRYIANYHFVGRSVYLFEVLGGDVNRPVRASWLNGRYVANYRRRSFEMILEQGCLRRFRPISESHASRARALLGDRVEFPGSVSWRTQAVLDALREQGVSDTRELMRIWGFGDHEWQGCHDLIRSSRSSGGNRIARKIARKMGLRREESDYKEWALTQLRPGDVRFRGWIWRATDDIDYDTRCRHVLRASKTFWMPFAMWTGTAYQTCFLGEWVSDSEADRLRFSDQRWEFSNAFPCGHSGDNFPGW